MKTGDEFRVDYRVSGDRKSHLSAAGVAREAGQKLLERFQ